MYWFTADEHYGHKNIIKFCNRPFNSVEEMDKEIIERHNSVVGDNDIVIHGGDFSLKSKTAVFREYINKLKGNHIFLNGSHDRWMKGRNYCQIWEKEFNDPVLRLNRQVIVVCHYALRTWARSHYNSWHLYGHSHGTLEPIGKSWDIGVDNNDFYPISLYTIKYIMSNRPDNPNLVKERY